MGRELDPRLPGWKDAVKAASGLLKRGDEIGKRMEVVGEEGVSLDDMIEYLKSELYEICYLQQNAFDKEDAYCPLDRQVEAFRLIQEIFTARFHFDTHDETRSFFLGLQNEVKNLNFLSYGSERYREAIQDIRKKIEIKRATHA